MRTDPRSPSKRNRPSRKRRTLALIAAGSVLGLGATSVLANWTDIENALGQFGTGTFGLEGSARAQSSWNIYTSHNTSAGETAAGLAFDLNSGDNPANVSPGQILGAKFAVRLVNGTTSAGDLSVDPVDFGTGPLADYFDVQTIYLGRSEKAEVTCDDEDWDPTGDKDVTGKSVGVSLKKYSTTPGSEEAYFCMLVKVKGSVNGVPLPQGSNAADNIVTWAVKATAGEALAAPIQNADNYPG